MSVSARVTSCACFPKGLVVGPPKAQTCRGNSERMPTFLLSIAWGKPRLPPQPFWPLCPSPSPLLQLLVSWLHWRHRMAPLSRLGLGGHAKHRQPSLSLSTSNSKAGLKASEGQQKKCPTCPPLSNSKGDYWVEEENFCVYVCVGEGEKESEAKVKWWKKAAAVLEGTTSTTMDWHKPLTNWSDSRKFSIRDKTACWSATRLTWCDQLCQTVVPWINILRFFKALHEGSLGKLRENKVSPRFNWSLAFGTV